VTRSPLLLPLLAVAACAGAELHARTDSPQSPPPSSPAPAIESPPSPPPPQIGAVRPWIGVSLATGTRGVRIRLAIDDTPGARAGLLPDDEILAIDGAPMHAPRDVTAAVAAKGVGTRVTLHILRAGAERDVALALEPRPDAVEIIHRKLLDKPAPTFTLTDAIGPHPASLPALAGKVVVVEFGATWCAFCQSTIASLDAWQTTYPNDVRVVWISSEPFDTIRRLDPTDHLAFTRARDPDDKLAQTYFVPALPTLVVIDRAGIVRAAELGAGDTVDQIGAVIAKLVATPTPTPPRAP
jgi:thiol-disulfide isomerase/thioredoxin